MPEPGYDLLDLLIYLIGYIEKEMGGKVRIADNEDDACITLSWQKYDEASEKMLDFNHKIAYSELISIREPLAIGKILVEQYNKQLEHLLKGE
jgi:hypothetical protein